MQKIIWQKMMVKKLAKSNGQDTVLLSVFDKIKLGRHAINLRTINLEIWSCRNYPIKWTDSDLSKEANSEHLTDQREVAGMYLCWLFSVTGEMAEFDGIGKHILKSLSCWKAISPAADHPAVPLSHCMHCLGLFRLCLWSSCTHFHSIT